MKDIRVTSDGKKYKVLINYIQRATYQSPQVANHIAQEIQKQELPHFTLTLWTARYPL